MSEGTATLLLRHFRGRTDVVAVPNGGGFKPERLKVPLTAERLERDHLGGKACLGLYTTSADNTVRCTAVDFDNKADAPDPAWAEKAEAVYYELCKLDLVPLVELSQSGAAAHVWLFFADPVPAWLVCAFWLKVSDHVGFAFKETFPKQSYLKADDPKAIGNLIRYPLWNKSCFVDVDHEWQVIEPVKAMGEIESIDPVDFRELCGRLSIDVTKPPAVPNAKVSSNGEATHGKISERTARLLCNATSTLAQRWEGNAEGLTDKSRSGVVMSLACGLIGCGVPDGEIRAAVTRWCVTHEYDQDQRWVDLTVSNAKEYVESQRPDKPEVVLPGGSVTVTAVATELGGLLAATGQHFVRGGVPVVLAVGEGQTLTPIKAASLPSEFESVATLHKLKQVKNETVKMPTTCPKSAAEVILAARPFLGELPSIVVLSPCPLLIERGGQLVKVTGYDRASGILAADCEVPEVSLEEARGVLEELLADFQFATPADRSRALAAIITPALVLGDLLGDRAPVDLGEADDSQSGKGFRNRLTAAIYGQPVQTVTQREGGVGSLEESFDSKLIGGAGFIALDNVRGKVNSPAIESFLTEDNYSARVPFCRNMDIDPRRVVVMLTSNRAELTKDFANRCSCVAIRKQPADYPFATYDEGHILDHLRANHGRYLGAVFAVVRKWHDADKPQVSAAGHDFRKWAGVLGWIVQEVLGAAPLMDGHTETQRRMSTPALTWLRDVCHTVERAGLVGQWIRASQIWDVIEDEPDIITPGVADVPQPDAEEGRRKVLQCVGRQLAKCFKQAETVTIDAFEVARMTQPDAHFRQKKNYYFRRLDAPPNAAAGEADPPTPPNAPKGDGELFKWQDEVNFT